MAKIVSSKTFEDLIKDVHEKGLCGECGGCVSFCTAGDIKAIEMSESGPPKYTNKDLCRNCGICYFVCPQTHVLDDKLNEKFNYNPPIGSYKKVSSVKAVAKEIVEEATDGGAVTAILTYLLEHNLINGAIVCKKEGPFNRVPFLATTKEGLLEAAGSHYDIFQPLIKLDKYITFIPTNVKLKDLVNSDFLSVAIVGTPCQIHSIRKMQELRILPAHIVNYTLGLFCNLNFSFNNEAREKLEQKFIFSFKDVKKINIKENLILQLKDDRRISIEFNDLYEIARPACFACRDFSNVYADISFGGLGSKDGYTTTIIRTEVGQELYDNALKEGYIKEPAEINTSSEKSEILNKVIDFGKKKIERYQQALKE